MEERTDLIFLALPLVCWDLWKRELIWPSSRYHWYAEIYGREYWLDLPHVTTGTLDLWKRELTWSSSRYHWYADIYWREHWPDRPRVTIGTLWSMEERTDLIFLSLPLVRWDLWKNELTWSSSRYHWYAEIYGRENWLDLPHVNIGTLRSWTRELAWSSSHNRWYAAIYGRTYLIFLSLPLICWDLWKKRQLAWSSSC